ncbi:hypothetical protein SAZ_26385 [Streptomyces noursei ZPM]|nr:hypothetical protein SAZ_26385 [Streptomyces noursei ZPM]
MANAFLKSETIAATSLGLLERELVLANLVWSNAGFDFTGAKADSVTVRIPAQLNAREYDWRNDRSSDIVLDELAEDSLTVQLNKDIYSAVAVTDEELTLDIRDFGSQVLQPQVNAVAKAIDAGVANMIETATYSVPAIVVDEKDPFPAFIDARAALNKNEVPTNDRTLVPSGAGGRGGHRRPVFRRSSRPRGFAGRTGPDRPGVEAGPAGGRLGPGDRRHPVRVLRHARQPGRHVHVPVHGGRWRPAQAQGRPRRSGPREPTASGRPGGPDPLPQRVPLPDGPHLLPQRLHDPAGPRLRPPMARGHPRNDRRGSPAGLASPHRIITKLRRGSAWRPHPPPPSLPTTGRLGPRPRTAPRNRPGRRNRATARNWTPTRCAWS